MKHTFKKLFAGMMAFLLLFNVMLVSDYMVETDNDSSAINPTTFLIEEEVF